MKFPLSTVLLVLVVISVSLGWLVDRSNIRRCYEESALKAKVDAEIDILVLEAVVAAQFTTMVYTDLDESTDFKQRRRARLLQTFLRLYMNKDNAEKTTGVVVNIYFEGGKALHLLKIPTVEEFESEMRSSSFSKNYVASFFDSDDKLRLDLASFIQDCLDSYKQLMSGEINPHFSHYFDVPE